MTAGDSSDFLRSQSTWYFVLQYPIVSFILAIAQSITQALGIYCLEGKKAYFAHLWVGTSSVFSDNMFKSNNPNTRSLSLESYPLAWQWSISSGSTAT